MILIPRINPAITFRSRPVDISIFNYPQWKQLIPSETSEYGFQTAWYDLFKARYIDCKMNYGNLEFMDTALGNGLIVYTPTKTIMTSSFGIYTDEPVLAEGQTYYYEGAGCTWAIDLLGQKFWRIDPATNMPVDWNEVRNWEIIKRYQPFMEHYITII